MDRADISFPAVGRAGPAPQPGKLSGQSGREDVELIRPVRMRVRCRTTTSTPVYLHRDMTDSHVLVIWIFAGGSPALSMLRSRFRAEILDGLLRVPTMITAYENTTSE